MKRFSAVQILSVVFALVIGIGVGGLGPRAQVRDLEAQLAEKEECTGSAMGSEIANVFRGRPWEEGDARPRVVERSEPEVPADEEAPEDEEEGGLRIQFGSDGDEDAPMSKEEIDESLDLAREAMELRYAQAREALVQDADPSEEQLAAIDEAIDAMNQDLVGLAQDLKTTLESQEEPGRRETMEFAADTLDVLLAAEDRLRGSLSDDQVASLQEESLDPMSYVDPSIVDILGELNR